jgi:hypothetical protein
LTADKAAGHATILQLDEPLALSFRQTVMRTVAPVAMLAGMLTLIAGCSETGHSASYLPPSWPAFTQVGTVDPSGLCIHVRRGIRVTADVPGRRICYDRRLGVPGACVQVEAVAVAVAVANAVGRHQVFPSPASTRLSRIRCTGGH